jgi:coenzyme F420 hydrogenase subunit beta
VPSVEFVVQNHLCHGCGICYAVCPKSAIHMENNREVGHFVPTVDENCINCKLCLKVCPGYNLDIENLNKTVFNSQPDNVKVGAIAQTYVGYSNDNTIRFNSASGGLITQILSTLIEEHQIDGALVTSMNPLNPIEPMAILASTKEEIIEASRSKYCPVTLAEAFKKIVTTKGKYAVVGLPCHIHGIRKAEQQIPFLKERIVLHLGLLCSHMVGFTGIHFLLKKQGVMVSDIVEMQYRGRGWPGSMLIKLKNGTEKTIPLTTGWFSYWPMFSSYFFTPIRCLMCPDQMAEFADISFGDAWLPEYSSEKVGRSIIISKNEFSNDIIKNMIKNRKLDLKQISVEKIEKSQNSNLVFKKNDLGTRLAILSSKKYKTPIFNPKLKNNLSFFSIFRTFLVLNSVNLSKKSLFKRIGIYVPFPIFRLYSGCFKYLYKI